MLDSIKQFFIDMYNDFIGFFIDIYDSVSLFISQSYDIILLIISLLLAFAVLYVLKFLTVPVIILSEMIFLSISITAMVSFVVLLSTSLVAIYNRIYVLSDYISTGGNFSCLGHMFDCLAINGILSTYFTELFALFIVVLLLRVSVLFLWAFDFVSDKIWRIGVLLGLVL